MRDRLVIIPAAGTATRMGGLPKFLLPSTGGNHRKSFSQASSLLQQHINYGHDFADLVMIVTRPENAHLLNAYTIPNRVEMLVMETKTMTETILRASSVCNAKENLVLMPDTYFSEGFEASSMTLKDSETAAVGLWKIRKEQIGTVGQIDCQFTHNGDGFVTKHEDKNSDCEFPFLWGTMNISSFGIGLLNETMPHVGYLISKLLEINQPSLHVGARFQKGDYLDCGTPQGYFDHLLL
jgi:hypothetical protein